MSGVTDLAGIAQSARDMAQWAAEIRQEHYVKRIGLMSLGGGSADAQVAALALARTLSLTSKRVMLVDLTRTGSVLGGLCGIPQGPGLSNLVAGTAQVTKVIARDARSRVHVLRYGTDHSIHAAELILERIDSVLKALASTYDTTIVNLGEAVEDTPFYLPKCEAVLIMAPASRITEAATAVQTLMSAGMASAHHVLIGQPAAWPVAEARQEEAAFSG